MPLPPPRPRDAPFLPADTFADDVVLITGGGTGLGKAMAEGFARLGARVVVASRSAEHLAKGVAAVEAVGGKAVAIHMDVRSAESVKAAFDEAEKLMGPVTILINNAAANFPAPAEELSANGWRAITQITLDGPYFCSTEFARRAPSCASAPPTPGPADRAPRPRRRPRPAWPTWCSRCRWSGRPTASASTA